jgi:hypothetical protein
VSVQHLLPALFVADDEGSDAAEIVLFKENLNSDSTYKTRLFPQTLSDREERHLGPAFALCNHVLQMLMIISDFHKWQRQP